MVRVPEGTAVSTQGQHYGRYKGHADQRRSFKLSSGWVHFFKLENLFLISQATKLYYLVAFNGVVKDRFSTKSESMKSATTFLAMSSASIRSLAMPGLAGTPKDKKYGFIVSNLELKRLMKPETASSTPSILHWSRLNISFQSIEEMFQYIELWCDE